ncbi:hypothetical protein, partial [Comamonas antarctica]|uniref:hypothetical protein n=1 Tax=Comamonas antarctica TaxID=2743470 RepID=UPI0028ED2DA5
HTASAVALVGGGSPPRPGGHYQSCVQQTLYMNQPLAILPITVGPTHQSKLKTKMFGRAAEGSRRLRDEGSGHGTSQKTG